jgi:hypothetical protein
MKHTRLVLTFLMGLLFGAGLFLAVLILRSPKPTGSAAEREQRFEASMRGVTLVGYSTALKRPNVLSSEERYMIDGVTKINGTTWLFRSRMKLGNTEVPLPLPVNIEWAGDTPVLTMTDMSVPGFGAYTVRLVFYGDQYAGTWMGKGFGGQMFGRIVRGQ